MGVPNFMAVHSVAVEIFQSGPKRWTRVNTVLVHAYIEICWVVFLQMNHLSIPLSQHQEPSLGLPLLLLLPLGPQSRPNQTMARTSVRDTLTPLRSSEGKSLYLRYRRPLFLKHPNVLRDQIIDVSYSRHFDLSK